MTTPLLHLDDLARLATIAGHEIMSVRAAGFEAMTKGDGSVVTIADQRAEAIIEAGLAKLAPGVPVLAEEACAAGHIPDLTGPYFCVDPLDGTRGFARGGDEFTVNIALIENGAPVQGVICAPASGEVYVGEPGRALRALASDGAPLRFLRISATPKPAEGWRIITSRLKGQSSRTRKFLAALGAHSQISFNSSIKFCRLAEGAGDLYPRFGEMSEWDAAAGHAILAAVGGGVMRLDGVKLGYGDVAGGFRIANFIAYATAEAAEAARTALKAMPPVA